MTQAAGNLITTGYWQTPHVMPGRVLAHWVGTAIITEPDIDWDVLDFLAKPLPIPPGTRLHAAKMQLHEDLSAPAGMAVKLGQSATDNSAYIVTTAGAGVNGIISAGVFRTEPATPFNVNSGITFGLFAHSNNNAPGVGQRVQAAQTTPINTLSPASVRPKPVRLDVEIWWSRPDDGPLSSHDIRPCPLHERLLAGLQ